MSLIENLQAKALEAINDADRQKDWVEKGYDAALKQITKLLPAEEALTSSSTPEEKDLQTFRQTLLFDLSKLEKHKPALVGLGEHGLRSTIALVGLGNHDAAAKHAALVSLRTTAGWGQIGAAILSTAEAGNQQKRDLDKKIADLKVVLRDLGSFAATRLLPFLLALL